MHYYRDQSMNKMIFSKFIEYLLKSSCTCLVAISFLMHCLIVHILDFSSPYLLIKSNINSTLERVNKNTVPTNDLVLGHAY